MRTDRRARDVNGWLNHRLRRGSRPSQGKARLVRRIDIERALSNRGQENHGLRTRRTIRLAITRRDHLSDGWRYRLDWYVESFRRDGADGEIGRASCRERV